MKSTSGAPAKIAANWIQTELLRSLNDPGIDPKGPSWFRVARLTLDRLLKWSKAGKSLLPWVKKYLRECSRLAAPNEIMAAEGLTQIFDLSAIEQAAREVIDKNSDNVAKFRSGNEGVFKFFVGQVMRATRGQANPQAVNDIVRKLLSEAK